DLGFAKDYSAVWKLQKEIVTSRKEKKIRDVLILVEHDHVLTMGRSSHLENLLSKDLPVYEIERGGDVTYHGPGQIVAYPILSLEERGLGVRQYIELLESVIVESLESLGLGNCVGKLGLETGVWTAGSKKIASIGVAVSHWVTYHGFALNVNTELSHFQKIKPCGFDSNVMTSISKELGREIEMADVKRAILSSMSRRFAWWLVESTEAVDRLVLQSRNPPVIE
ncbi:MAG: lipoyl(octanoyl) transferase LipB, partial [Nitrososphaerales archaeon]